MGKTPGILIKTIPEAGTDKCLTHFSPLFRFYTSPPLKKSENQIFSDVFRGYKNETLG